MPTADNLNEMSWSDRRRNEQQNFNAIRDASQARINDERAASSCDNLPTMPRATFAQPQIDDARTPMTSAEAGSLWSPR